MRILPPALLLIFAALMIAAHLLAPVAALWTHWPRLIGATALAAGIAIAALAARQFRTAKTNIRTFDDPTTLVTSGFFRWSRNPMYLGFVVALTGLAVALGTVTPFLLAAAYAVIADRWYVAFEEAAMARRFGDSYAAYRKRVRRWI